MQGVASRFRPRSAAGNRKATRSGTAMESKRRLLMSILSFLFKHFLSIVLHLANANPSQFEVTVFS